MATEAVRNAALFDVVGRNADGSVTLESVTHQEIASRVGASRELVSRLLKDLEKGGYIEMGAKRLVLLKKLPARW